MSTTLMARERNARKNRGAAPEQPVDDRSNRKTAPIQVDKDLARMAAVIASHRGITQAKLVSPHLRPYLIGLYQEVQEEIAAELEKVDRSGG